MSPSHPRLALFAVLVAACARTAAPPLADPAQLDPEVAGRVAAAVAAARAEPDNARLRLALGMLYDAHARVDLAEQCYAQALALDDTSARAWYHLARMRYERGDPQAALAALDEAAARAPERAPIQWRRGLWLAELRRTDEARRAFQRALELDPEDPVGRLGLARLALEEGRPADAIELAQQVLAEDPGDPHARHLLGTAFAQAGQEERAAVELARARGSSARFDDAWELEVRAERAGYAADMADALERIRAGRAVEIIDVLERMLVERPDDVTLQGMLAAALGKVGAFERAIALLEAARARQGEHYRIELNLGITYALAGDDERALAHTRRAVALHPGLGAAHLQLGRLLLARDAEGAVQALAEAVRLGERDLDCLLALAGAECARGRADLSARVLERAAQEHPASPRALALLARARAELGQLELAREAWQRAARLDARDPLVREVGAALAAEGGA